MVYKGIQIRFKDNELVNLTSMWKAAGSVNKKRPGFWLENQSTKEFIQQIQAEAKKQEILLLEKGRYSGTFAHWKLGLYYAAFLNPEIHSWYMDVVREWFEEEVHPDHSYSSATNSPPASGSLWGLLGTSSEL